MLQFFPSLSQTSTPYGVTFFKHILWFISAEDGTCKVQYALPPFLRLLFELPVPSLTGRHPSGAAHHWMDLATILQQEGLMTWQVSSIGLQRPPNDSDISPNGYVYATNTRQEGSGPGKIAHLRVFWIRVSSYTLVYPSSDESPPRTDLVMLSAQAKGRMPFYE